MEGRSQSQQRVVMLGVTKIHKRNHHHHQQSQQEIKLTINKLNNKNYLIVS